MSTILKALQRLEDEKASKPEPTLNDQVVSHDPPPPPRRGLGWLGIAGGLVAGICSAVAFFYVWLQSSATPETDFEATEVASIATPPMPAAADISTAMGSQPKRPQPVRSEPHIPAVPKQARARQPAPRAMPPPEVSQEVEVVKRVDPRARAGLDPVAVSEEGPAEEPPSLAERRARRPKPSAPTLARREPAAPPPTPAGRRPELETKTKAIAPTRPVPTLPVKPEPITKPVEVASVAAPDPAPRSRPPEPEPAKPQPIASSTEPLLDPVPVDRSVERSEPEAAISTTPTEGSSGHKVVRRAALPELRVRRTIWHPDVARRIAFVELLNQHETLEMREGDAVGPLVLEAIKPSGVRFVHDGVAIHQNIRND